MGTSLCVIVIREYGKLQYLPCRGQWCWTLLEFGIFHFQTVFFGFFLLFFFFHFSPDYLSSCEHQFWNCFIRISVLRLKIKELIHTHWTSNFTFDPLFTRSENHSALLVKFAPDGVHRPAVTDMLQPPDGVQLRGELQIEANYILSTAKWFAVVCP